MNNSSSKKIDSDRFLPQGAKHTILAGRTFFCAHTGPSMNPTLTVHDLLEIEPYRQKRAKAGDVIFFRHPRNDYYVVHRIIRITPKGIQTRGDNNIHSDPWCLNHEDIYGRIISTQRGENQRRIIGGFPGKLEGMLCHLRRNSLVLLKKIFGPAYRSLCTGGILHWMIPFRFTPQISTFRSGTKQSHKLLLGSIVIGSYDDSFLRWRIKHPYRLVIDESDLPLQQ